MITGYSLRSLFLGWADNKGAWFWELCVVRANLEWKRSEQGGSRGLGWWRETPHCGAERAARSSGRQGSRSSPGSRRACASCPSRSGMLLPLLRRSCFPSSSPGGGGGGGGAERVEGARGPGARGRRPEREPYACMDPSAALHRRPAGGGLGAVSPALSGGQARRRKQPPRPADFKLQVIIIGSRGVGKTSLMERFTDDTFCEACKSTVGTPGLWRVGLGAIGVRCPSRWRPDPLPSPG